MVTNLARLKFGSLFHAILPLQVYNCLYSLNDEKSLEDCVIHSHAFDTFTTFGVSQVNQLMQMLQRTLQLADVTKLHKEKDHKQVVEILKAALKDTKAR